MNLIERALNGLALVENRKFSDSRGFFEEFFNLEKFTGVAGEFKCVQVNHSRSRPGVLRGLHYQLDPAQGKFVGVIRGRIWDVAVDIRPASPTRGQYFAAELSDANSRMLWIPAGFAHGFYVMGDEDADVIYLVDNLYNPKTEGGVRWDDPDLAIEWPVSAASSAVPIVSDKDQSLGLFKKL